MLLNIYRKAIREMKAKLWTGNFVLCTGINLCLMLDYYLLITVMTQYVFDQYQASEGIAGLTSSIFIIGTLAARMFAGSRMERIGKQRMVLAGAVLCLIGSGAYFLADRIWLLIGVRLLHGAGYGLMATAIGTVVTSIVPVSRRGEGIGYYMLSYTFGAAAGPFLAMFLNGRGETRSIFLVGAAIAVASFLGAVVLLIKTRKIPEPEEGLPAAAGAEGGVLEKRAVPISLTCAMVYFCYSSLLAFLMPFSITIGQEAAAQYFFLVYALAMLVSRPFTGRLFDVKGEWFTIVPGILGFALGMLILSRAASGVGLLCGAALLGYGMGVTQSAGLASAVSAARGERLSQVNSTFFVFADSAIGVGPLLLGYMLPYTGYRSMYLAMAAVSLVCTLIYHKVYMATKRKNRERRVERAALPMEPAGADSNRTREKEKSMEHVCVRR